MRGGCVERVVESTRKRALDTPHRTTATIHAYSRDPLHVQRTLVLDGAANACIITPESIRLGPVIAAWDASAEHSASVKDSRRLQHDEQGDGRGVSKRIGSILYPLEFLSARLESLSGDVPFLSFPSQTDPYASQSVSQSVSHPSSLSELHSEQEGFGRRSKIHWICIRHRFLGFVRHRAPFSGSARQVRSKYSFACPSFTSA